MRYNSIDEVKKAYDAGVYFCKFNYKDYPTYASGHIFDENLTVKRNREMVEEANKKAKDEQKRVREEQNRLNNKLFEDCVDIFVSVYPDIAREVFEKIVQDVYNDKHDCMNDFFYYVDAMADWFASLLDVQQRRRKYWYIDKTVD